MIRIGRHACWRNVSRDAYATGVLKTESDCQLKALVVKLSKGLPSHVPFKLPTTIFRGSPSDEMLEGKIDLFLKSKGWGWSLDESCIEAPDPEKVAAFQRKVWS